MLLTLDAIRNKCWKSTNLDGLDLSLMLYLLLFRIFLPDLTLNNLNFLVLILLLMDNFLVELLALRPCRDGHREKK